MTVGPRERGLLALGIVCFVTTSLAAWYMVSPRTEPAPPPEADVAKDAQDYLREKKPEPLALLEGHRDAVYGLAFHEPSHRLVSSSYDGEVRVWDTETGQLVTNWLAAPGYPATLAKP